MRRVALALLLLLTAPVSAQMSTGGGPKDSPPYDNETCALHDSVGDSLGFVAWARPRQATHLAAQWRRISPDTTGWRPTLTAESWVDTNAAGVCMVPIDTEQDTAGIYEVRTMLAKGASTSSWETFTFTASDADSVAIYQISGALRADSTVTITGVNFGTKDQATPVMYDDGSDESYAALANGASVPTKMTAPTNAGAPWNSRGTRPVRFISDSDSVRVAGRPCYRACQSGFFRPAAADSFDTDNTKPLVMSWWVWYSHPTYQALTKYLRMWTCSFGEGCPAGSCEVADVLDQSIYLKGSSTLSCGRGYDRHYYYTVQPIGQWHHLELTLKSDGALADGGGTATLTVNGLLADVARTDAKSCYGMWDNLVAWGYDPPNPAAINVDGLLLFGELYVDNTLARVIIGDASTWAKVRHWEIQPATTWADGEITITMNQGSFASSASAWLYIVNADGLYNSQGYPLIIGSSVAPVPPSPNKTPGYQFNEYPAEP